MREGFDVAVLPRNAVLPGVHAVLSSSDSSRVKRGCWPFRAGTGVAAYDYPLSRSPACDLALRMKFRTETGNADTRHTAQGHAPRESVVAQLRQCTGARGERVI
eukprot:930829-Prymnesium_polylepis.1